MEENILEISINVFIHNLKEIREKVPNKDIIPVIKANGYGTGIAEYMGLNNILEDNKINIIAVAQSKEGMLLRKNGVSTDILLLNELLPEEIENAVKYNLTVGVSTLKTVELLNECAKKQEKICKIHIKIDTGMGRVGIKANNVDDFCKRVLMLNNIVIDGIYTHLSCADSEMEEDIVYTNKQLDDFEKCVNLLNDLEIYPKYIHANASAGIIKYNDGRFNSIRPGIILYGYLPSEYISKINYLELRPIAKLKSKVVFLKDMEEGSFVGYSRTFKLTKRSKIATVCMGYADGLRRLLSNTGEVIIRGKKAKIIGNICMDNFMVDVTDIPDIKIGDEVLIWDNDNITLDEIAKKCNTINYEILCGISERVKRKII